MFAYQKEAKTDGRGSARRGKMHLPFLATSSQLQMMEAVAMATKCQNRSEFISAAVLWFDSLSKRAKIEIVVNGSNGQKPRVRGCVLPVTFGELARAWHFPTHSLGHVLAAAASAFSKLPSEKQIEWVRKVVLILSN